MLSVYDNMYDPCVVTDHKHSTCLVGVSSNNSLYCLPPSPQVLIRASCSIHQVTWHQYTGYVNCYVYVSCVSYRCEWHNWHVSNV